MAYNQQPYFGSKERVTPSLSKPNPPIVVTQLALSGERAASVRFQDLSAESRAIRTGVNGTRELSANVGQVHFRGLITSVAVRAVARLSVAMLIE